MKKIIIVFILLGMMFSTVFSNSLTAEQWKEDIKTFKDTAFTAYLLNDRVRDIEGFYDLYNFILDNVENMTDQEIIIRIIEMTGFVSEGHLGVWPEFDEKYFFPIEIKSFDGVYYIIRATKEYKEFLGSEVLGVNGIKIDKLKEESSKFIAYDNKFNLENLFQNFFINFTRLNFKGIYDENVVLNLLKDGKISNVTIIPQKYEDLNIHYPEKTPLPYKHHFDLERHTKHPYWYDYDENNNLIYFKYDRVRSPENPSRDSDKEMPSFEKLWNEVIDITVNNNVEYFILDIRHNPGGFLIVANDVISKINVLSHKTKIYIITGIGNASAASVVLGGLVENDNIILIGEPTGVASSTFGGNSFHLPNSNLKVSYGNGILKNNRYDFNSYYPHINIPENYDYFKQGLDASLQYIFNYNKYSNDNFFSIPIINNFEYRYFDIFSDFIFIPFLDYTLIFDLQLFKVLDILDFKFSSSYFFNDLIILSDSLNNTCVLDSHGNVLFDFNYANGNLFAGDINNTLFVKDSNVFVYNHFSNSINIIPLFNNYVKSINTFYEGAYVIHTKDNHLLFLNNNKVLHTMKFFDVIKDVKTFNNKIYLHTHSSIHILSSTDYEIINIPDIQSFYINEEGLYIIKDFELFKYVDGLFNNEKMIFNPYGDKLNENYIVINDGTQLKVFGNKKDIVIDKKESVIFEKSIDEKYENNIDEYLTIHKTENYEIHEDFFGELRIYDLNNNLVFEKETENIPFNKVYEKDGKIIINSVSTTKIIDSKTYDYFLFKGFISLDTLYSDGYLFYQDNDRFLTSINIYNGDIKKYYDTNEIIETIFESFDKSKIYTSHIKRFNLKSSNEITVINKETGEIENIVSLRKADIKEFIISEEGIIVVFHDGIKFIYDTEFNLLNIVF